MRQHLILIAARSLGILLVVLAGMGALWYVLDHWSKDTSSATSSDTPSYTSYTDSSCNIAVIPLQGVIVSYNPLPSEYSYTTTSGDAVVAAIKAADADSNIKGIMLQIDSTGGAPAASEAMMNALKAERLPTVALVRESADSGAYMAATGANTIIASEYGDVGSIGITYSYVENVAQNQKDGLQFVSLSSGPYKDTGNPNKTLSANEIALYQRDIGIYSSLFVKQVAENRNLPLAAIQKLADGSSMPASLALKAGLIDAIGGEATAQAWFTQKIGTNAVLCDPAQL